MNGEQAPGAANRPLWARGRPSIMMHAVVQTYTAARSSQRLCRTPALTLELSPVDQIVASSATCQCSNVSLAWMEKGQKLSTRTRLLTA